jgi:large subunit ribosomal protein L4
MQKLGLSGKKTVFVTSDMEKEVLLSSRNVPKTQVTRATDLNTYQVLNSSALVLSEGAIGKIVEKLA